jgi:hypothetical protein
MYVPAGEYRVTINENAIDDRFELEQKMFRLSVTARSENYYVTFLAREKERKLKVKKFRSDGSVLENE